MYVGRTHEELHCSVKSILYDNIKRKGNWNYNLRFHGKIISIEGLLIIWCNLSIPGHITSLESEEKAFFSKVLLLLKVSPYEIQRLKKVCKNDTFLGF